MSRSTAALLTVASLVGACIRFWLAGEFLFGAFGRKPSAGDRLVGAAGLLGYGVALVGLKSGGSRLLEKKKDPK